MKMTFQEQFQRLQNMQKSSSLPGHSSAREFINKAGSDQSLTQSSSGITHDMNSFRSYIKVMLSRSLVIL